MIEKVWKWFVEAVRETVALSWTLVGLLISYFTLTGAAQQITGLGIVITLTIWLLQLILEKMCSCNYICCGCSLHCKSYKFL